MIVELDSSADTRAGLLSGLPSVQIDARVFQDAPKARDEDGVQVATFAFHGDPQARPAQRVCPAKDVNWDP